ncbi:Purine catabolism regulatory protein [bacterium HR41]|nr:Purine catabolism regulatory protein [bacterium HR41]
MEMSGPAARDGLAGLAAVSEMIEAGAGLSAVARAASRALGASLLVADERGAPLVVASASSAEERALRAAREEVERVVLRVADRAVGELRLRYRRQPAAPEIVRAIAALIALEVERGAAPDAASERSARQLVAALASGDEHGVERALGALEVDLAGGATVLLLRARPPSAETGDWRERLRRAVARTVRATVRGSVAAPLPAERGRERSSEQIVLLVPGAPPRDNGERVRRALFAELEASFPGYSHALGVSRPADSPGGLARALREAELAANVAEAHGERELAFDDTGSYRLLLPALANDAGELERFYQETIAPIAAYDEQYETELVRTLETFLELDGSFARTAERLYTHRHTIRYRLERVRELTGLDVASSEGRERLSLGLKAMRVLGIVPPGGPAHEPGAAAGRVPRGGDGRD